MLSRGAGCVGARSGQDLRATILRAVEPVGSTSGSLVRRGGAKASGRERLQRLLAGAGVGARRACERMIEEGRVSVNGKVVRTLPVFVDPAKDRVWVDGREVVSGTGSERRVYVMLHKPARVLTVGADEPGADRTTVLDLVKHPGARRLFPVGRLDYEATGLVLLTNDGEMTNVLTHPRYGVGKTYHALIKGMPGDVELARLEREIRKAGGRDARRQGRRGGRAAGPGVELRIAKQAEGKTLLEITLREGRNPRVQEALAAAGWPVKKLTHVKLGPLELKGVALGSWRELKRDEIGSLRRVMAQAKKGPVGAAAEDGGAGHSAREMEKTTKKERR